MPQTLPPEMTPDATRLHEENQRLHRLLSFQLTREMIGVSPAIQSLREQIADAAQSQLPVLVCGEPGSGTSLAARLIHVTGPRGHRPLLRLDCGLRSAEAMERELFEPHPAEPSLRASLAAEGGSLVLEQVDQLAVPLQRRLVAAIASDPDDCRRAEQAPRLIAVTRADLSAIAARGLLAKPLLDLLEHDSVHVPPLRHRSQDLGPLVEHFVHEVAASDGRPAPRIALDVLELVEGHDWPGNIRELKNVIRQALVLDCGPWLTAAMLDPWLTRTSDETSADADGLTLRDMERKLIETTFARYSGNRERTAAALQIGLRTLSGKLREYGYPPRGGPGSNRTVCQSKAA